MDLGEALKVMAENMADGDGPGYVRSQEYVPLAACRFQFQRDEQGQPVFTEGSMCVEWQGCPDPKHRTDEVIGKFLQQGLTSAPVLRIMGDAHQAWVEASKKQPHEELADLKKSIGDYARERLVSAITNHISRNTSTIEAIVPSKPLLINIMDVGLKVIYESAPPYSIMHNPNWLKYDLDGALGRQDTKRIKVTRLPRSISLALCL